MREKSWKEVKRFLQQVTVPPLGEKKILITVLLQRDEQTKHGKQQKSFSHGDRSVKHLHLMMDVIQERSAVPQ